MSKNQTCLPKSLPGFDLTEGLNRVSDNAEFYKKLLCSFYLDNRMTSGKIRAAIASGDFAYAQHIVHAIKGVSGNLSARKLHTAAIKLEAQLKQESKDNISVLFEQFDDSLSEAMHSLSTLIRNSPDEIQNEDITMNTTDLELVSLNVEKLFALLDEFNIEADDSFSELKKHLFIPELKNQMHLLETTINNLDFDSAKAILSEIAAHLQLKS